MDLKFLVVASQTPSGLCGFSLVPISPMFPEKTMNVNTAQVHTRIRVARTNSIYFRHLETRAA